ncbi:hypothetical protein JR316_0000566 [Psilocybe cubensis]|uniref:Uncharacterized protein n=2 Tax=Psilocybe cubensis TaxID=181762 RepID=A0A8H7Y7L0_PSICU|nr:hypothetical protein JR316_0000566 [Psilocybe cubensis]KAH9486501.1 hypothetical protein JR316_0000566 [Psilocybe cubensis]
MILKEEQDSTHGTSELSSTEDSPTNSIKIFDSESENSSTTHSSLRVENPLPPVPLPALNPPRYSILQQQRQLPLPQSVRYTFMPQTNPANSMIMKPMDNHNLPSFYISINLNCFVGFSCITTIRKEGWHGEIIGDFELNVHGKRKHGTVSLFGYERILDDVFGVTSKVFRAGTYHWYGQNRFGNSKTTSNLRWEEFSAEDSPYTTLSVMTL